MIRRSLSALALSLCLALPVQADPRADAEAIVGLTMTEDLFGAVMTAQGPIIASAIQNDLRAQGINLADPQRFTAILTEVMLSEFTRRMQEETVPVYLNAFTAEELAGILAFYRSAPGQALLAQTPMLTQQGANIGSRVGMELGPMLGPRMAARLEAEGIQLTTDPAMNQRLIDALR
ncbi:DUF2059 domain-containing protein [Roseibacterium beibuensis]|uniref:DUF2059 domain-containing protein n=1 Tax=[Roseibacterium] beibuensis TaxID=1193142 RepID=A0ABP9LHB5_9RHOB|nr:DUF2059 domain-containing protein [Roseibacterium beibuensis]MCS6623612.1 DUF2059 domain-containing protein [Roseibacterium beibuensis]